VKAQEVKPIPTDLHANNPRLGFLWL